MIKEDLSQGCYNGKYMQVKKCNNHINRMKDENQMMI
jgi:hypothetical protein